MDAIELEVLSQSVRAGLTHTTSHCISWVPLSNEMYAPLAQLDQSAGAIIPGLVVRVRQGPGRSRFEPTSPNPNIQLPPQRRRGSP
jgi:hypothetical protein